MNLKQAALAFTLVAGIATGMTSCKSQEKKDAEAKAKIEAAAPGVTVDVKNGVATLSGQVTDDAAKTAAEEAAKKIDGVKSVVNNTTVTPPPPPPAPVTINPDDALTTAVTAAIKAYPGVTATVKDGVISVAGEIKKADWRALMPILQGLKPKSVDSKGLTIK